MQLNIVRIGFTLFLLSCINIGADDIFILATKIPFNQVSHGDPGSGVLPLRFIGLRALQFAARLSCSTTKAHIFMPRYQCGPSTHFRFINFESLKRLGYLILNTFIYSDLSNLVL